MMNEPTHTQHPTVVVVNDDPIQRASLAEMLMRGGLKVRAYARAVDALANMSLAAPPDLIITDLYMPDLDGWRFCRLLRSPEYAPFNRTPILVVSATYMGDEVSRLTATLGANAFLAAPVNEAQFVSQVWALLRGERPLALLRALIIQDSHAQTAPLQEAFSARGYRADFVSTGREAAQRFQAERYSVVILDECALDEPVGELLASLRREQPGAVYIVLAANPSRELALAWLQQGAAAYVRPPYTAANLVELCIQASRAQDLLTVEDRLLARTRELRESEARHRALFETMAQGVVYQNAAGQITLANPAAERILGLSLDQMQGRTSIDPRWRAIHEDGSDFPGETHPGMLALRSGQPHTAVMGVYNPQEDAYRWIVIHAMPQFRPGEDRPYQVYTTFEDITAPKLAEERLRRNEEVLRLFIEHSPAAIAMFDREMRYIAASRRYLHDYGLGDQNITGRSHYEIFPEIPERIKEVHRRCLAGAVERAEEEPFPRADGRLDWVRWEVHPWYEPAGQVGGIILFSEVITERKRAEQELREKTEEVDRYFAANLDLLCIADTNGYFRRLNPEWERVLGYSLADLEGKRFLDFVHPDDLEATIEAVSQLSNQRAVLNFTNRYRCRDGSYRWIEWRSLPQGELIYAAARDITDQIHAENALREISRKNEEAMDVARMAYWEYDVANDEFILNDRFYRMLGVADAADYRMSVSEFTRRFGGSDSARQVGEIIRQGIAADDPAFTAQIEGSLMRADGATIWTNTWFRVEKDASGKTVRLHGVNQDITDRKRAEEALRESEESLRASREYLQAVLDSTHDAIFVDDANTFEILDVNQGVTDLYGYSREEVLSKPLGSLSEGEQVYTPQEAQARAIKARQEGPQTFEWLARHKDGHLFWAEVTIRFVQIGGQDRFVVTVRDIDERKRAEEALEKRIIALTRPLDQAENIEFEDLFNLEEIQRLQDQFAQATGVASTITHTDGTPITRTSNACRFCMEVIRSTEQGRLNCYRSDAVIGRNNPEGPIVQPCLGSGLWDAGASITVGGRHIANWLIGQVRDETQTEEQMRAYARELGLDEDGFMEAFEEVPVMSQSQFRLVAQALFTLAGQLSDMAYQNIQQARFIAERRRAEEALRQSEESLRASREYLQAVLDSTHDAIFVDDANTLQIIDVNQRTCELYGYTHEEVLATPIGNLSQGEPPYSQQEAVAWLNKARQEGPQTFEWLAKHKDGHVFWVEITIRFVQIGGQDRFVVTVRDIDERKRAEEALEKRIIALTRPLGEVEDIDLEDLFNLDMLQKLQDQFAEATGVASLITHPDGVPITKPSHFCRLCADVVRQTELGRQNCYHSDATLGRLNVDGPIVMPCLSAGLSNAGASITVGGRHIANWLIGQVRNETQNEDQIRAYAREIGVDEEAFIEAFHEVPVMSREQFERVAQALFTLAGQLSDMAYQNIQQARLITALSRAEAEIRQRESTLRQIIDALPIGLWFADKDGRLLSANPAVGRIWGDRRLVSIEEYGVFKARRLPSGQEVAGDDWALAHVIRTGVAIMDEELEIDAFDGQKRIVLNSAMPLLDDKGAIQGAIVLNQDITERKRAEEEAARLQEQLLQAQKMESVGRLAGGVAHDFNNMLQAILGHAEMALNEMDAANPWRESIQEIQQAARRSADLTRQLLAFARRQTIVPQMLDLNDTLAGMLRMLQRLIGEDIHLAWIPGPKLWRVRMDPSQLDQILANLTVNARDAIGGVGRVTIETSNVTLDEAYCASHAGAAPGDYVMLRVSDTGCGMSEETMSHLFEPFFTTKGVGKGTGLGLATVYGIVSQNNGHISVESALGQGTTFRIYFPRYEAPAPPAQPERAPNALAGGSETVLMVEDEATILAMGQRMLQRLGYTVLTAGSPTEALKLIREHAGDIHLLMTDMVMPTMNGRDLAAQARAIRPGLKCLFMSGYTADIIAHEGDLGEGTRFIPKPFTIQDLAAAVREVLG